jgi:hypothetical protein
MPLYLCRTTNGDCSFVFAANKGEAIERLDEAGNAEGCPLIPTPYTRTPSGTGKFRGRLGESTAG